MKIAVCVKEVPDASAQLRHDESSKRLVREGDQVLNPYDAHAIEAALQLREGGHEDATVTALTMGPASAQRSMQKALALGADDGVLVADEALAGSDILATAKVLAAAIERGGYDLVIMGQQAADSDAWALPGVLAARLGWPVMTQASSLGVDGGAATVERQAEAGYETVRAQLPAVVSVSDAINEPRYPSLKAIMGAKRKPLEQLGIGDLGLDAGEVGDAGSRSRVAGFAAPPPQEGGVKVEDDGTGAEKLVAFLRERNLV